MKRLVLFTVVAFLLLTSVVWSAGTWEQVGINPTKISVEQAVLRLHFPIAREIVLQEIKNVAPIPIWIRKGELLKEITSDTGLIARDQTVGFDSTQAMAWNIEHIQVVWVLGCNNVGWRYIKITMSSLSLELAKILEKEKKEATKESLRGKTIAIRQLGSDIPAVPEESKKPSGAGFHFPWWLLFFLILPLLWWLWKRRKRTRSTPSVTPYIVQKPEKNKVKKEEVTPAPSPEEKKAEEKIIVTPVVVSSEDSKNKEGVTSSAVVTPVETSKEEKKETGEEKKEEPISDKPKWAVLLEEAQKELAITEGLEKELEAVRTWLEELKKKNADRKAVQLMIKEVLKKASAFYVEPKKQETTK